LSLNATWIVAVRDQPAFSRPAQAFYVYTEEACVGGREYRRAFEVLYASKAFSCTAAAPIRSGSQSV
jgi:hypothetical protein